MKTKYKFYTDPSHGWLAVKREELIALNILDEVSVYSYQRGKTVYLEEDRDASLFISIKKQLGQAVDIVSSHTDNRSPIRSYESFSKGNI